MSSTTAVPVVDLLAEEWRSIAELGAVLSEREWSLPSECPGWTVKDLVSHMVGTERWLLGDPEPPRVPDVAHVHNAVGAGNEAWVQARRAASPAEVLEEFREVTTRRLAELRSFPDSRFAEVGPTPAGEAPYSVFMEVRLMDCWVHEQDMRVATEHRGHLDGPVARLALDRVASAMPFVVGRKAAAPEGATVRFEMSGDPGWHLDVEVRDGRAHAQPVTAPGTVLQMDTEVFWRLGCGRISGAAALDAGLVKVEGDAELGRRVIENMAFMI